VIRLANRHELELYCGPGLGGPDSDNPAPAVKAARVRPSKSLGQNFLVQPAVAAKIVAAAEVHAGDMVIEIGPGLGILTKHILEANPQKLILVERDRRLATALGQRLARDNRVIIQTCDFLTVTVSQLGERLKVIGNLPFNVAGAILRHLSQYSDSIVRMVLMFQREVSERIRAQPGSRNYGALSVFSSLYWQIIGHFRVAAGSFHPRPKVDAEVLIMEPRTQRSFNVAEEADVRTVIRAAFCAPRKTIRNSLAGGLAMDTTRVEAALEMAKIAPSSRPAMLDATNLIALARIIRPVTSAAHRA
jgi:16S rRNA (adenine1518-N6/adenine1519-N6)-dimethyltransferase